ncbi:CPVL carboxypeptidase, partial [Polyodon spathula]|nr:CPVL carboxypeptidase [Polyodon spathula]
VLIYSGQLDVIVAAPLTERFLPTVPWSKVEEYKKADRFFWKVNPDDSEVAGYVRQVGEFYQVIVRGGGHILPYDQPERSFDMIDRFLSKTAW